MKEYFPHDYNARSDPKLQEVLMALGMAGLGAYWCIVEQMYEQGGSLLLESVRCIAFTLHIEQSMLESLINDFGLFEHDDVKFWSKSVLVRFQKREAIKEARSEAGKKGNLVRWGAKNGNSDNEQSQLRPETIAMQSQPYRKTSQIKEKENKSKVNKRKKETLTGFPKKSEESQQELPLSEAGASDPIESETKSEKIDFVHLMAYFNEKMKDKLPQVQSMTEKRKSAVKARAAEHGKKAIAIVIEKVAASNFLVGGNDKNWRADFDWMFRPTNFIKILEGNYDNNSNNGKAGSGSFGNTNSEETSRKANTGYGTTDFTSQSAADYYDGL